jgi:hypothetical protein
MKKQRSVLDFFKKESTPVDSTPTTSSTSDTPFAQPLSDNNTTSDTPTTPPLTGLQKKASLLFQNAKKRFSNPPVLEQTQTSSSRDIQSPAVASSSRDIIGPILNEFDEEDTQRAIEESLETKPSRFKRLSKKLSGIFTASKSRPLSDQSYSQSLPSTKKSKSKGKEPLGELSSEVDALGFENKVRN